eukprot:8086773-Pyramimonas_sp.AAC.1
MLHCLDSVFPQQPLRHLPFPDVEALQTAARLAGDFAPGPDGLPCRAWVNSDGSIGVLRDLLISMATGGPIPYDLKCAMMAMLPKGDEPLGNY